MGKLIKLTALFGGVLILGLLVLYLFPGLRYHNIIIHHTASSGGDLASIRHFHMTERGWHDIAYHFVVGNGTGGAPVGKVEPSGLWERKWYTFSTKNLWANATSIAIVLVGNFDRTKPKKKQLAALVNLVRELQKDYGIPTEKVIGHRDVQKTACPGRFFNLESIRTALKKPVNN